MSSAFIALIAVWTTALKVIAPFLKGATLKRSVVVWITDNIRDKTPAIVARIIAIPFLYCFK